MGLTKRILFGDDPAFDGIRQAWCEAAAERIAAIEFLRNGDAGCRLHRLENKSECLGAPMW
jgi:hypothetical protein